MINQIRGFLLEHGIPVRQGLRFLRHQLPDILARRIDVLSSRIIRIIEDLSGDWRRLDERIEHVTEEIEELAHGTESCRQLMTIPGIGTAHAIREQGRQRFGRHRAATERQRQIRF